MAEDQTIKNTRIYKWADGTFYVTFDTAKGQKVFKGTKNRVVSDLISYLKRTSKVYF